MELTIEQLMQGKATRIKDKEYFTTEAYVTPFIERVSKMTNNFIINARPADQISLTKDGEINFDDVIYNRVWIQGVLPDEYCYENHRQSISLLYALDTRKPVVKIFSSAVNMACLNMCVFDPNTLHIAELEPETAINYSYINLVMNQTTSIRTMLDKLSNMDFKRDEMFHNLGMWVDNCINAKINNGFGSIKLPESLPIDAYKDLFYDDKSRYFTTDNHIDGFTVYNAFTDIISNDKGKDIVNKFEKILLIKDIMNL